MPYINSTRPSHLDADTRALARQRAEQLDDPRYRARFIEFMHSQRLDEQSIQRELQKLDQIVETRHRAASQDTR